MQFCVKKGQKTPPKKTKSGYTYGGIEKSQKNVQPQHASTPHAAARRATTRHATARNGTPRQDAPRHGTPRHATARHARTRHDTPRHGTPRHETARHDTARHESGGRLNPRDGRLLPERTAHWQGSRCHASPMYMGPWTRTHTVFFCTRPHGLHTIMHMFRSCRRSLPCHTL